MTLRQQIRQLKRQVGGRPAGISEHNVHLFRVALGIDPEEGLDDEDLQQALQWRAVIMARMIGENRNPPDIHS